MIPLVLVLWEHVNFSGVRRTVVDDVDDLSQMNFNDKASSIGVHPGPDYPAWKAAHAGAEPTVTVYEHAAGGGAALTLTAGSYPDVHARFSFGDLASSVRFNAEPAGDAESTALGARTFASIPVVTDLFTDAGFRGLRTTVVEDVDDLGSYFGGEFNDATSSVRVRVGPSFKPGKAAILFRDAGELGGAITLPPGNYPDIGVSNGFNDVVSSVKVS
jgi:hypothetical protein